MTAKFNTTHLRMNSKAAANMGLTKVAVQWLIEHFCFVFATFTKPRNVSSKLNQQHGKKNI